MAKIQIRKGYSSKMIEADLLPEYLKDGWGKVVIKRGVEKTVVDYKKGSPIKVKQKQDIVTVEYAIGDDVKAKDKEIEALKKQLAAQK
jgi:hypothetical protein